MEIYTLDSDYKRLHLIDSFSSFIWTERFGTKGDFQIDLEPSKTNKSRLKDGVILAIDGSDVIMEINSVKIWEDQEGKNFLQVKGSTLESMFDNKVITPNGSDNKYSVTGNPGTIVINMFRYVCFYGNGLSPNDVIPNMVSQNQAGTEGTIEIALPPQSLYKAMKDICDANDIGMKVILDRGVSNQLFLVTYKGIERKNVIFSSTLDTIAEESYLTESENYRNVAYVYSKDDTNVEVVYAPGTSSSVSGKNRRVMVVSASDVDPTKYTAEKLSAVLQSRGKAALAETKKNVIFDGVITSYSTFEYGVHYKLGDTVYIYDELGNKAPKVVSEYIWAWDAEGLRSYPTFVSPD